MTFIHRLDVGTSIAKLVESDTDFDQDTKAIHGNLGNLGSGDFLQETKRSYKVMELLGNTAPNRLLYTFSSLKIGSVVLGCLAVFHPASRGNYYHACKILSYMVTKFPEGTCAVLACKCGTFLLCFLCVSLFLFLFSSSFHFCVGLLSALWFVVV